MLSTIFFDNLLKSLLKYFSTEVTLKRVALEQSLLEQRFRLRSGSIESLRPFLVAGSMAVKVHACKLPENVTQPLEAGLRM
jgi:hypothetical protein